MGGLQEVLPDDMVSFAEPTVDSLVDAVCSSLDKAFLMSPR